MKIGLLKTSFTWNNWGHTIDLENPIHPGLHPSLLNDDALARRLDRLYKNSIHHIISACLIHISPKEAFLLPESSRRCDEQGPLQHV
ncbi:DUF4277 domain-containing protein [Geobacillus thermoleovorans]|uniref:DUF4277 domain-containing protein n=1 Tax=Bacillus caldolyticus TaxID=1394 RepID=A0ABN5FUB6_BACCL|nr:MULTISPECIES: DUF4277 domain-containing protein [Geobacillus]AUI37262.1 DUF4277 domain-containing protein [[Bacillus] caldolyticus]MED3665995.1 DUF4277 domain-containing protein [Geobacillus kaustophilus]OQP11816.1 hypothetical protein B1692_15085 [Geobacillus thermoleovorans]QDY74578.1 DUF4277 domain-containing protein [Geobacillus thermoleovorans]QNU20638.1 DUF4277 domain-containing protein [Geobacillus thermoleovorans]